jgi:heptosyltransferase II
MSLERSRILFVKLGAIGDAIQSAVALHEYRARNPGVVIDWLIGKSAYQLIDAIGVADHLVCVDDRALLGGPIQHRVAAAMQAIAKIRENYPGRYDGIYTGYPDRRYRLLTLGIRSRERRSLGGRRHGRPSYIFHRSRVHELWRLLTDGDSVPFDLVAATKAVGAGLRERTPIVDQFGLPEAYVVIAAGGARNVRREDALRRWPIDNYRQLVLELTASGLNVVLVGASTDQWVADALSDVEALNLIGKTDLLQLFSVMQGADAVISNDSGVLHLATLTDSALVALFGPTPANATVPYGRPRMKVLSPGNRISCSPCYDGRNFAPCVRNICLESISVASVVAALRSVTGQGQSRGP